MDFSKTIIRRLAPAAAALVVFFVVSAAYFAPQFRGEVLPQHDVVQYEGMAKDISDMRAATGEDPKHFTSRTSRASGCLFWPNCSRGSSSVLSL